MHSAVIRTHPFGGSEIFAPSIPLHPLYVLAHRVGAYASPSEMT